MAKAPTSTDKAPQQDVLPLVDELDDVEVVAAPVADVSDDVDEAPEKEAPAPKETPREAAVRRYRELRDGKAAQSDDAADDEADAQADPVPPAPAPVAAKPAPTQPVTQAQPDADPEVEVNGRKIKQSELIAKALASESILEEIKALREETRPRSPTEDQGADDDAPSAPANAKPEIDAEKLETIVERIQIGDKAEGTQALAELIELVSASQKAVNPDQIGRVVTDAIANDRNRAEIEQATTAFAAKYDAVVNDPEMLDISLRRLTGELREDLVKIGVKPEDANRATPDQLMTMHNQARARGHKVRAYNDIFDKVGSDIVARYGTVLAPADQQQPKPTQQPPTPQATRVAERVERKRQAAVQPRTAGVRTSPEPAQKPKSRADVLAEMRRSRGFPA